MRASITKCSTAAAALALTAGAAQAADINVGSVAGVTGPIAELVAPIVAGRNLAAQHVNDQGGLLDGDTSNLILADSQCDPKAGVDAATKVVNVEQVVAVLGASCSGATNGMVQSVTIPAGVVALSDSATAPSITELQDNDLVFRVAPSDAYQGLALAQLAIDAGFSRRSRQRRCAVVDRHLQGRAATGALGSRLDPRARAERRAAAGDPVRQQRRARAVRACGPACRRAIGRDLAGLFADVQGFRQAQEHGHAARARRDLCFRRKTVRGGAGGDKAAASGEDREWQR
jgi:hypothetical protein